MPKEIKKTVYTFKELMEAAKDARSPVSQRAVERAREWLQQGATDHDWYDTVYEDWKTALDQVGFENAEISFSGFWSQGDGASFTADVDVAKLVNFLSTPVEASQVVDGEEGQENWLPHVVHSIGGKVTNPRYNKLALVSDYLDCNVKRTSSHYSHENTCEFEGEFRDTGECGPAPDYKYTSNQPRLRALADAFFEDAENLRKDLCKAIYKALEEEYEYQTADEQLIDDSDANEYTFDEDGRRDG